MCKKCKKNKKNKKAKKRCCLCSLPIWAKLLLIMTGGLGALFTVYFFNLDMKLTALMEPWLLKWYDHIDRDKHL